MRDVIHSTKNLQLTDNNILHRFNSAGTIVLDGVWDSSEEEIIDIAVKALELYGVQDVRFIALQVLIVEFLIKRLFSFIQYFQRAAKYITVNCESMRLGRTCTCILGPAVFKYSIRNYQHLHLQLGSIYVSIFASN